MPLVLAARPNSIARCRDTLASVLRNRLAINAGWLLLGNATSRVAQLLIAVTIARFLGSTQFGAYGIIQNTVSMVSVFAGFGLSITLTKYLAQLRFSDPARAARIVALSLLFAATTGGLGLVSLIVSAPWVAAHALADPSLALPLRLASAGLAFAAITSLLTGLLQGLEAFRLAAFSSIAGAVLSGLILISFTFCRGLEGAAFGTSVAGATTLVVTACAGLAACRRAGIRWWSNDCTKEWRVIMDFSLPALLSGCITMCATWLASTFLARAPHGYEQLGLYNAANTYRTAVLFVPLLLAQVAFPRLAATASDPTAFSKMAANTHNYVVLPSLFLTGICAAFPRLLLAPFGSQFAGAGTVLRVLMISVGIQALGCVCGTSIQVFGDMWVNFLFNLGWALAFVAVVFYTAPTCGATALGIAAATAYCLLFLAQLLRLGRRIPPRLRAAMLRSMLALLISAAASALLLDRLGALVSIPLALAMTLTLVSVSYVSRVEASS